MKKIVIINGYGRYCDCREKGYDCVVLYGAKCDRDIKPKKKKG